MTTDQNPDFDGCNSECRKAGKHSLRWGGCEQATPPEPTVSMSVVYTDHDGGPSIGFDTYTVPELARLIEPVLGDPLKAAAAARRIVHRHDEQQAAVPSAAAPPTQAALRERIAAAMREHCLCTIRDEADADGNLPCRCGDWREPGAEVDDENDWDSHLADVALAVLPAPVDRAAVLASVRPHTLVSLACHLDARAVAILRAESETYAEWQTVAALLRRLAEAPQPETQGGPRRGDAVEQWLKTQRDEHDSNGTGDHEMYDAIGSLLDTYRLHADTGTPLGEHVCEGRAVGDCECLERPAKKPPMDPVHILGIGAETEPSP